MRISRIIAASFTVAILTLVGVSWLRRAPGAGAGDAATSAFPTATAQERPFSPRTLATGTIRLRAGARIEVGARISGVVQSLAVTQGSRVDKGDVIARLDTTEAEARVAQADAKVAELEIAAHQLELDLARSEAIRKVNGVSDQELLAARTAFGTARARLAGGRADRDLARIQLGYSVIRAPISGVVASVTTHEGETVAASLAAPTFVTLIDPSRLECVALVDETDISHVAIGDHVEFTVDAYPGRSFPGVVVRVAPDATVISGVVDYEVTVRITSGLAELKPQMTTSVTVVGTPRTALVIPMTSVRQSPQGTYVWRVRNGVPERVTVRLGGRQSDVTEVLSGLSRGDVVLTADFPEGK